MSDIIIPSYNTPELLQNCINSIRACTKDFKIIIVDNGSEKERQDYLDSIERQPFVTIIRNKRNMGFGYANNQGLRVSKSSTVCFLNSDTVVTDKWLVRMQKVMLDNKASLIGCMTDYVDETKQKIIPPKGMNLDCFAENHFKEHGYKFEQISRVIGFCMLVERSALREIGDCFDTRFERGNFEDDDICLRLREQGHKIGIAKGVFIRHVGSQTLKKMGQQEMQDIFLKNRDKFNKKWHTGRIEKLSRKRLTICYAIESNMPCGGVKVIFEHANRLHQRGHNVSIIARYQWTKKNWFDLLVPIVYTNLDNIPECDIAVSTFYITIPSVMKSQAKVKVHLSQGFEGSYQDSIGVTRNYQSTDNMICVSKWLKELIRKETGKEATYIRNGLDQYVYSFKLHALNMSKPRVLVVGDEIEIKNVRTVLSAMNKIRDKIVLVRMFSEKDPTCESYKMPDMTQQEIAEVYDSCDIVVSASRKVEGFGLPPLEGMASGCVVVTTDNGGNGEYIKHGINCLVVDGSERSIAEAVLKLINNPGLANDLTRQGLITANQYKWDEAIDDLENFYFSVEKTDNEEIEVPDIVAVYKTFRGDEFLIPSIESIYPYCKKIVLIHCNKSWNGREGNTCAEVVTEWAKYNDKDSKIVSVVTDISDQTEAYQLAWKYADKTKHDWKLLIDTDEVWDRKNIRQLISKLKHEQNDCIRTKTHYYLKSPEFQMYPQSPMIPVVMCRANMKYSAIRMCTEQSYSVYPEIFFHHFSLVRRTLDECMEKQNDCNVAEDVGKIKWERWIKLKWDLMPNPLIDGEQFRRISFSELPETMRKNALARQLFEQYHTEGNDPSIPVAAELLAKHNLPSDFSPNHPDYQIPSRRNKYRLILQELIEKSAKNETK